MAPAGSAPDELEADDLRNEHGDRLAQHGRFGLDAAHAPAQHAQAIDHRRVRIGADDGVGIRLGRRAVLREHHAAQELEVHLVDDAGVRRHHLEIAERSLAPAQERVALAIAFELDAVVVGERLRRAVFIHLHGVVDDELGGRERIDLLGVATEPGDGFAHGGQIDHAGHAGEVLHDHARGREGDLVGGCRLRIPVEQGVDVLARDVDAILEAQQVLEQDLERVGKARDLLRRQGCEAPDGVVLATCVKRGTSLETVGHRSSVNIARELYIGSDDDPAAEAACALINHGGLAGRDGPLRLFRAKSRTPPSPSGEIVAG